MQEETKLPPNELPDGNLLGKKMEVVERENDTAIERAKKAKKAANKSLINNAHHLLFTLSSSCSGAAIMCFSTPTLKSILAGSGFSVVALIAYGLQLFLHELAIKSNGDMSKWSQMFGEKTGFARRG